MPVVFWPACFLPPALPFAAGFLFGLTTTSCGDSEPPFEPPPPEPPLPPTPAVPRPPPPGRVRVALLPPPLGGSLRGGSGSGRGSGGGGGGGGSGSGGGVSGGWFCCGGFG